MPQYKRHSRWLSSLCWASHTQGQDEVRVVVFQVHPGMMCPAAAVPTQQDMRTPHVMAVYPPLLPMVSPRIMDLVMVMCRG